MAPWRIVDLMVLPDFRLRLRFQDGVAGTVDMSTFLASDLTGTVFAPLQDPAFFARAYLDHGAVTWPGEVDLAPDALHREIAAHGTYRMPPPARRAA